MATLTPIVKPINSTPKPCFWCEYSGTKIIRRDAGEASIFHTSNQILCGDTKADVDAQIATLKLTQ